MKVKVNEYVITYTGKLLQARRDFDSKLGTIFVAYTDNPTVGLPVNSESIKEKVYPETHPEYFL